MNRNLLFSAVVLLAPIQAYAQSVNPNIHKLCIEAKDYAGCVKSMTNAAPDDDDSLTPLRSAMKQVAARLRSGTSLRDSTETFRPVVDQLAIAESNHPGSIAVQKAKLASRLFDALYLAWDTRIKAASYQLNQYGGTPIYNCRALQLTVDNYNSIPGAPYVSWSYKKGLLGLDLCKVESSQLPEVYMMSNVVTSLDEGAISPAEIAAREKEGREREEQAARERELCAMGPWNRYLEETPAMKEWAKANPTAAEATKKKFLADPKNQSQCSTKSWGSNIDYGELFRSK